MKLRVIAAIGGGVLIVGAGVASWDSWNHTPASSGDVGVITLSTRAVERGMPTLPIGDGAPPAPLIQESREPQPDQAPTDVTPGRLLAALGAAVPLPLGVSFALVECAPAGPEEADVSFGSDELGWLDVGAPVAPDVVAEGVWEWQALRPGTWRLVASEESTYVLSGRSASPLVVRGGRTTHVDVGLVPAGVLSGRLVRAAGDGVAGAAVRVVGPLPSGCSVNVDWGDLVGTRVWRRTTDDNGIFTLSGLESGQDYGVHGWSEVGDTMTAVVAAARPPVEILSMIVTEPRQVLVRVTARVDGRGLPGAEVKVADDHLNRLRGISRASSPNRPLREAGTADAVGLATLSVEPGAWLLVLSDGFDMGSVRVPLSVADGDEIVVALDEPGDGRVFVVSAEGSPIVGASIVATVNSYVAGRPRLQDGGQAVTDSSGAVRLSNFGHWSDMGSGSLRLAARHDTEGIGGLELDIGSLLREQRGFSRTLVLRRPGSLEIDMTRHGWPEPTLNPYPDRFNRADIRERHESEQLFTLTLWYLGAPGLRTEFSTHHREQRVLDPTGFAGGLATARFDELEPGDYCVELWSPARGVSTISPALRVGSGETTFHWIAAPDATTHGRVTVVRSDPAGVGSGERLVLLPAEGFAFHGASPLLFSPKVAFRDRRTQVDASGRATFDVVPPGRWIVGSASRSATGALVWLQSPPFLLGPGDDLLLDVALEPAVPPNGLLF